MVGKPKSRGGTKRPPPEDDQQEERKSQVPRIDGSLAACTYQLGGEMLWDLQTGGQRTLALSPLSIAMAIGMLAGGAGGQRQQVLARILTGTADLAELTTTFGSLLAGLEENGVLTIGNALFFDQSFTVDPAYNTYLIKFAAESIECKKLASAATQINDWIASKTRNLIHNMVNKQALELADLCIVNALSFNARWRATFPKKNTVQGYPFDNDSSKVTMMFHGEKFFDTAETKDFVAVRLPYTEAGISMIAYLPHIDKPARELVSNLQDPLEFERKGYSRFGFPKFNIETDTSLLGVLKRLGYPLHGYFPAMGTSSGGKGGQVVVRHRALVKVDELGTVAAAATAIIKMKSKASRELPQLIFDRPFLFSIVAEPSKVALFVGTFAGNGNKS